MENNGYIYIVLIRALTGLGKFSRKISRYEYTHIAMSFDEKLVDFITFSRRNHFSPFNAGFMHEKREHYAFGANKEVKVRVFKIPVSDISIIKEYILKVEKDDEYVFNLYSMLTMPILHGLEIYKAHNCMSFVGKIIELSNCVELKKRYYKYDIKAIDELLNPYFLSEYYLEKENNDDAYMVREGILRNLKNFFMLNLKLLYRMLFKRKARYE